ncbi:MAG: hypothetical protein M3467_08215, partial [Actinomycetota bacterium]|nr:hypothetical protein [Actinomycetota bacterium]
VVTLQSVGASGQSLSVWGIREGRYVRQRAKGGCWTGSHTFGIVGATIELGRITASCDGSPLPRPAWPSDVYEWRGGRWRFAGTQQPDA